MKLSKYIVDKLFSIIIIMVSYSIIILLLLAFKIPKSLIVSITFIFMIMSVLLLIINFYKKKKFYDELINNISFLDKKYLVLETISKPDFYEGKILFQLIYEINKSMIEYLNKSKESQNDFKDYVEMWIHEVKIPISSLILLCHNHRDKLDKAYLTQVRRLDNYVDQVLYYVRSNYTYQDFIIRKTILDKVIGNIAIKNKDDLLENNISLMVDLKNISVYTDSKWLEFILNQIINNSIKYKRENVHSYIKIRAAEDKDNITLSIYDNGIGIPKKDLNKVFKKSFTGENGRLRVKSTGMGLYIANKLCKKLGHEIKVESKQGKETKVSIIFGKNNFYSMN